MLIVGKKKTQGKRSRRTKPTQENKHVEVEGQIRKALSIYSFIYSAYVFRVVDVLSGSGSNFSPCEKMTVGTLSPESCVCLFQINLAQPLATFNV